MINPDPSVQQTPNSRLVPLVAASADDRPPRLRLVDTSPRVLSIIPPMTQLNTPYPSTAYLTGFLRSRGIDAVQDDLALGLVLRLFSQEGLTALRQAMDMPDCSATPALKPAIEPPAHPGKPSVASANHPGIPSAEQAMRHPEKSPAGPVTLSRKPAATAAMTTVGSLAPASRNPRKAVDQVHRSPVLQSFSTQFERYLATIEPVIAFLQGRDPTLAHRIVGRCYLPEGSRFASLEVYVDEEGGDPLGWAFGALGVQDRARHFATLYLNDLADVVREAVDPRFEFVRYAESLAQSQPSFEPLATALAAPLTLLDRFLDELVVSLLARHAAPCQTNPGRAAFGQMNPAYTASEQTNPSHTDPFLAPQGHTHHGVDLPHQPDFSKVIADHALPGLAPSDYPSPGQAPGEPRLVVLLSVPFPGSVYGAFRIAQTIKRVMPQAITVLGGGYVNTELRELAEPRVFDYFDYVTLDAGEQPLIALLEHRFGSRPREGLQRTYLREDGRVRYIDAGAADVRFDEVGTPTWDGLPTQQYLSLLDMLNPMHRLWSDGRWNKLTVAQGCYWKKCSFCDVSLDYIGRYETAAASILADRIDAIVAETGQSGFHFVDEAAPPKALRALAEELLRRRRTLSWWGNVRFEKSFTPELCHLLAESGCIAISGGLEVASDRLLKLMQKGVSVAQVARVTHAFTEAGILVHAYLMYGFPTQTVQETVDALEYVRQLFAAGCIQSGFFHRFACTVHSPVGLAPQDYGIRLLPQPPTTFARNDVGFIDPTGVDHDALGKALNKALYNFMHGLGLEEDVRVWFAELRPPREDASPRHRKGQQAARRGGGKESHRGRPAAVPRTTVPPYFIEQALAGR